MIKVLKRVKEILLKYWKKKTMSKVDKRLEEILGMNGPSDKLFDDLELVDGVEQNKNHPLSYWIPSIEEKRKIQIGDVVKVSDGSERWWNVVEEFIDEETMICSVDNHLVSGQEFNFMDKIVVKMKNIIDIHFEEEFLSA